MLKTIFLTVSCIFTLVVFTDSIFSFDSSFFCVPLKNFSGNIYSETTSKYIIVITGDEFVLPDTSTQIILNKSKANGNFLQLIQTGRDIAQNTNSEISKNYLPDSRLLNLDDPEIIKLRQRFNNPKNIINDIEKFVYNHINIKKIGIPIISATEILKNKTGDCTEHTVLTVSILRSAGIPARALIGMLLSEEFEGKKNVFVYHMWAEAFVNSKWMLVDSTLPGQKHENRYVAFAYHHLQTEMPLSYLKAVSAMKKFSVEYVRHE